MSSEEKPQIRTPSSFVSILCAVVEVGFVFWAVTTNLPGPGNLVKLWGGFCVVATPALLYATFTLKHKDPRPTWVKVFMNISDLSLILILAWHGWWGCTVAYGIGSIASAMFRSRGANNPTK